MARHYSTSPDYPQEPEDKMYSSTILARIFTLVQLLKNAFYRPQVWCLGLLAIFIVLAGFASISSASDAETWNADQAAKRMVQYFDRISQPKPFTVRTGEELKKHNEMIRQRILKDLNLDPLPERIDLDPHYSDTKEHPWCTIRRVAIQLWPGVYSRCLLYMPRQFPEKPAPAALCPHGHEAEGYADPDLQKRFLMLAKLGYVVLSTPQDHHEDILRGYSYQTYLTWNNMRAMDFLETLPEVDKNRIGVSGLSGGGLQSQMIVGLDPRIKAATIAGLTCDYREITFPFSHHCFCNHWPNVMTYTDQPEISTLSCPTPVQYLTMNDWTQAFRGRQLSHDPNALPRKRRIPTRSKSCIGPRIMFTIAPNASEPTGGWKNGFAAKPTPRLSWSLTIFRSSLRPVPCFNGKSRFPTSVLSKSTRAKRLGR